MGVASLVLLDSSVSGILYDLPVLVVGPRDNGSRDGGSLEDLELHVEPKDVVDILREN